MYRGLSGEKTIRLLLKIKASAFCRGGLQWTGSEISLRDRNIGGLFSHVKGTSGGIVRAVSGPSLRVRHLALPNERSRVSPVMSVYLVVSMSSSPGGGIFGKVFHNVFDGQVRRGGLESSLQAVRRG